MPSDSFLHIVREACGHEVASASGWQLEPKTDPDQTWIWVPNDWARTPDQGWKLHVSACFVSAKDVLGNALTVLMAEDAIFKIAYSVHTLCKLNAGDCGLSQVGKFITVYPNDDAQAVRLAAALDRATAGLRGPAVPSDRPLAHGSLVHYRYGGFDHRSVQTRLGEVQLAISTPEGALVPDRRTTTYFAPEWVEDPFVASGVAGLLPAPEALVGGRYLAVSTLYESARGAVYLALDVATPGRCVLKRAYRDGAMGTDGTDARDRLRNEAGVLARLSPDPRLPRPIGLVEQDGDLFLAMEDLEGEALNAWVDRLAGQGRHVPLAQVVAWGRELASILGYVHSKGLAYRDLKSSNIMVTPEERLRLLDFDIAQELESSQALYSRGTPGYRSPEQEAGAPPSIQQDVYGLGALLYFLATGAEPSAAPRPSDLLSRPLALMNPAVGRGLAEVIARCLHPDPDRRFSSMREVDAALEALGKGTADDKQPQVIHIPSPIAQNRYRKLARQLGDSLCEAAELGSGGQGLRWADTASKIYDIMPRGLYKGSAGVVLALAELVDELRILRHRDTLAQGARGLVEAAPPEAEALPGLYSGEAGVGVALLRAGQALDDGALVDAAVGRGRWIAAQPHVSPDLFGGSAGRLRFHLWLWDETAEREHLLAAGDAGEYLLGAAENSEDTLKWTVQPGHEPLDGDAYPGYACGAAGIADVLLDLYEATGDERFLSAAQGAGRWLAGLALPALDDESGLDWPAVTGGPLRGAGWSHGAAGVGRFFLHCAELDALPDAALYAKRAAKTVANGTRWAGPAQYAGLAGNIEYLLDMFQAYNDRAYLEDALLLARLLETFIPPSGEPTARPAERLSTYAHDYMTGQAGVAVCLLRLSDPPRIPHRLSHRGSFQTPIQEGIG